MNLPEWIFDIMNEGAVEECRLFRREIIQKAELDISSTEVDLEPTTTMIKIV